MGVLSFVLLELRLTSPRSDDKENKFGVESAKDKATLNQWLFFQASGQGPYFGQSAHFKIFAPEKIPCE